MAVRPDFISRLMHLWFLLNRPATLGVRAIAFDEEDRLLLVRHTYVDGWHLPGGGVETGDTVAEALSKELSEEANVVCTGDPVLLSIHLNTNVTRRDHVVVFHCRAVSQTAPKQPDREIVAAEFFAQDDLPDGITASTIRRIAEFRGGLPPDPYW